MTDKSELNLAQWSRWDDEYVRNDEGTSVAATPEGMLEAWVLGRPKSVCFVADALAVIRAAGLDPEFEREQRLLKHLQCHGYSSEEIERIASGNDIESDQCCPQALSELNKLDELRERLNVIEVENAELRSKIDILARVINRDET